MLRIASGTVDQYLYFDAGQTGLSAFTVYRARNGGTATVITTPTIAEVSAANMPGIYTLLMDEDMVAPGNITEHMIFRITHAGIEPIVKEIELFNPANYVVGTVTNLTNLPAAPADWLTSTGLAASAIAEIQAGLATSAQVTALNDITASEVWAEVLGTTTLSASAILQIIAAVSAGKLSGAETTSITIRNVQDTQNTIVATVDANGNRSAITITTPAT